MKKLKYTYIQKLFLFFTFSFLLCLTPSCSFLGQRHDLGSKWGSYSKVESRSTASNSSSLSCFEILSQGIGVVPFEKLTKIEKHLGTNKGPIDPEAELTQVITRIADDNPDLAHKITKARRDKKRGKSILLDLSDLEYKMVNFLEGPYKKVVGNRGLSEPFVDIRRVDDSTMIINHFEDKYPLMVKWTDDTSDIKNVTEREIDGVVYRYLEIPSDVKGKGDFKPVADSGVVVKLISASRLNRYNPAVKSDVMKAASLLHDGKLIFDRHTQFEADEIRKLLD